jgi:hypothetical protein
LRGSLDEISNHGCTVEARVFGTSSEIMDSMAQFVEQSNNLVMLEERGFGGCRLREIADKCSGGVTSGSIRKEEPWLKREVGCMAIFAWARM